MNITYTGRVHVGLSILSGLDYHVPTVCDTGATNNPNSSEVNKFIFNIMCETACCNIMENVKTNIILKNIYIPNL